VPRAATRVLVVFLVAAAAGAPASASPATDLGDAFRAYDDGDLTRARRLLGQLDDRAIANRDYLWWLRGMVALRTGELGAARTAFDKLAKLGSSRFARELPWRLADLAWQRGDRSAAAKAYA
jgi:hypothetical protein